MYKSKWATLAVATVISFLFVGCTPNYPNCNEDSHCQEGEYCVNNLCQQCRDNGDCPEGQECVDGACREIPGYCQQSSDCSMGQVCRDNRCSPCLRTDECTGDQVCIDGQCRDSECDNDEDCPAGLICENHLCKPDNTSQADVPSECQLESVYFDFDSSELGGSTRGVVERNYECLNQRGGRVTLEGHCDPRGTTEYNMALGERRARVVKKMLKTLGYDASKAKIVSKGEEEARGSGESSYAQDRRVEFK